MNFKLIVFLSLMISYSCYGCDNKKAKSSVAVSVSAIDWYKGTISPMKILTCSYHPSCSQYTKQAIERYGLVKGWLLGCDRLMRCNHDLWVYREVVVDGKLKKYNPVP